MEFLLVYFYLKDGLSGFGSCKGSFGQYPPTMTGIKEMQNQIKEAFSHDEVIIISWLPLTEEKKPEDEVEFPQKAKKKKQDFSDSAAAGFVSLAEAVPDVILEIRYYSSYNFVGERIDGYEAPCALLTKEAAEALKGAAADAWEQGYMLKIYDAYRPQMAVDHFIAWAEDVTDTRMKKYFYPELDKSVLFDRGYIAKKSSHSRGSTVDLTLFDMDTGKELDMGGPYDYFGELSHPDYVGDLKKEQIQNRNTLRNIMMRNGFKPLDTEWWHFTLENEPYPNTYFTFTVKN